MLGNQRVDDLVQGLALDHLGQLVEREVDTVIGDASLGKIIGANALRAVATADLAASFGCRGALPDGTTALPAANPDGFCDHGLQPTIDAALSGAMSLSDALATVEPALWQQHVAMPLFQLADVLATGPEITGVNGGPPLVGPFADAPTWRRSVRK